MSRILRPRTTRRQRFSNHTSRSSLRTTPTCHFCGNKYEYSTFYFWECRKDEKSLYPAYLGNVGNIWTCLECADKEERSFEARGWSDPVFGFYEGECIYAHACSQDNSGVACCLMLMDWQQDPKSSEWLFYGKKTWDRVCLPCQAYYELCLRDEVTFFSIPPRPTLKPGQLFS